VRAHAGSVKKAANIAFYAHLSPSGWGFSDLTVFAAVQKYLPIAVAIM
jgi:hypothetical protein